MPLYPLLPPLGARSPSLLLWFWLWFMIRVYWALWVTYRSQSSAIMRGALCPWDGPPERSPLIHPSIHPSMALVVLLAIAVHAYDA